MLRFLRSRYQNRQVFETSVDCAKQRHSATTAVEVYQGEGKFTPSTADNLQRLVHVSRDKNHGAHSTQRLSQDSFEIGIAGVEKYEPRFHRKPVLAFNWPLAVTSQATAVCRAIDFRLRSADWRFDISPLRHA